MLKKLKLINYCKKRKIILRFKLLCYNQDKTNIKVGSHPRRDFIALD